MKKVLQWVAIIGTGAAAVLSLIALGEKISRMYRPPLSAEASFSEQILPPDVGRALSDSALEQLFRDELFRSAGNGSTIQRVEREFRPSAVARKIQSRLSSITGHRALGGRWDFRLRNRGSETLIGVSLSAPNAVRVSVAREGERAVDTTVSGAIKIGELQPDETVVVRVWTTGYASLFDGPRVRLVHSRGRGAILVAKPAGAFGRFADAIGIPLLITLWLVGLIALISSSLPSRTPKGLGDTSSTSPKEGER